MPRFNPGELEIELFCRGIRIDPSCTLERDARGFHRIRAGLGSGLEMVIPGDLKEVWCNVPVGEGFVADSPFLLRKDASGYGVVDGRDGGRYQVWLPDEPAWYARATSSGTTMSAIGVLQGTYLGIYISETCRFWDPGNDRHCQFCTSGLNVGTAEALRKKVSDVVEVARAARSESGATFIHFNAGYQREDRADATLFHGLNLAAPYVKAVREQVGGFIGVQVAPVMKRDFWKYDWLIDLGVDHFSFCYEFHNPEYFERYCPGKCSSLGQKTFFDAMEYTSRKLGKGAVSGEIIAGIEPVEDTLKAIDFITSMGAFPTVCIFRPLVGSLMEDVPSPDPADMRRVFEHLWHAMVREGIPSDVIPNIQVSLIVNPGDAGYLVPRDARFRLYRARMAIMRTLARPYFARRMRARPVTASATEPPEPRS
ncbi:MAG: radical SAM protein [Acidobacteriota bacterium]